MRRGGRREELLDELMGISFKKMKRRPASQTARLRVFHGAVVSWKPAEAQFLRLHNPGFVPCHKVDSRSREGRKISGS